MNSFTSSTDGLCPPPIHPDYKRERGWQKFAEKAVEKDVAIQQSMSHMNDSDKEFMNEQRKYHQHKERLFTMLMKSMIHFKEYLKHRKMQSSTSMRTRKFFKK